MEFWLLRFRKKTESWRRGDEILENYVEFVNLHLPQNQGISIEFLQKEFQESCSKHNIHSQNFDFQVILPVVSAMIFDDKIQDGQRYIHSVINDFYSLRKGIKGEFPQIVADLLKFISPYCDKKDNDAVFMSTEDTFLALPYDQRNDCTKQSLRDERLRAIIDVAAHEKLNLDDKSKLVRIIDEFYERASINFQVELYRIKLYTDPAVEQHLHQYVHAETFCHREDQLDKALLDRLKELRKQPLVVVQQRWKETMHDVFEEHIIKWQEDWHEMVRFHHSLFFHFSLQSFKFLCLFSEFELFLSEKLLKFQIFIFSVQKRARIDVVGRSCSVFGRYASHDESGC